MFVLFNTAETRMFVNDENGDFFKKIPLAVEFTTTNDGTSPFDPSVTKTGVAVSWDLGNGDVESASNSISYSGYVDSSEKKVSIFSVKNYEAITEIVADDDGLTGVFGLSLLRGLEKIEFNDNQMDEEALFSLVSDLWEIRSILGGNSCSIRIDNNLESLNQASIDKIEGTGVYLGDGLKDAGCSVVY